MRWRSSPLSALTPAVLCNCVETITVAPPEEQSSSSPALPSRPQSPWIYRPWIDLTVGCGAWSAPLLLAGFYFANSYERGWSVAFYFLALLSNYPHFMATVYRAYHTRDEFEKYRLYTVHVALLLVAAGVVTHVWYALLPWIFTLYICWSPWHYSGQKFWIADDVLPARGRYTHGSRTSRAASFLHRLLYVADAELPYRRVRRCTYPFSRARR